MKPLFLYILLLLSFSFIAQNLYVEGSATIVGSNSLVLNLRSSNPLIEFHDNESNYLAFLRVSGNDLYLANRQNGRLFFRTDNRDRMTIHSNGNVGIGTFNPESKFTINGTENNGSTAGLQVNSGSQKMILDGNEIDCTSGGLHLNYNSGHDELMRTATRRGEISFMHNNGSGIANVLSIEHPGANNAYWTLYSTNSDGNLELYYKVSLENESFPS